MTSEKKREWVFVALVVLTGLFVFSKSVRLSLEDGEITMTISQNKNAVSTIDTPRSISTKQEMQLRRIDFPQTRMLESAQYGKLGFSSNFFMDFVVGMEVQTPATYYFTVKSDDGFRLKVDDKLACEHPGDRPMTATKCPAVLDKGLHTLTLSYFQGGGPLGLQAFYRKAGEKKDRFVGEDSDDIIFEEVQK